MMMWRTSFVLAALAAAAPLAGATTLSVTSVDQTEPGLVRVSVRYDGSIRRPSFRLTPACTAPGDWVVASTVSVLPERRHAVLEVSGDLGWLTDRRLPCQARGLNVEMLAGTELVARAEVPLDIPAPRALAAAPPPPPAPIAPRLGIVGHKLRAPQTKTSEAGLAWAVSDRVTLNLTYERTAYAPMMPQDHDDGILTGVKLGF